MSDKRRQRTAKHHLRELDRIALGMAEEAIQDHNFKKLLDQGVIVPEKKPKRTSERDGTQNNF
jgi:hypothetical protein